MKTGKNPYSLGIALALTLAVLFPLSLLLSATPQTKPNRVVSLTVNVVESGGRRINGARINIYRSEISGSVVFAKPPDYQEYSNQNGTFTFNNVAVKAGEKLAISVEITADGMETKRQDFNFGTDFPDSITLPDFILVPRGGSSGDMVVTVEFTVHDGGNDHGFLDGVTVTVTYPFLNTKFSGKTVGGRVSIPVALTHNANFYKSDFTVQATMDGYSTGGSRITLYEKDAGKTVFGGPLVISKLKDSGISHDVTIHVIDPQKTPSTNLAGAKVQLDLGSHYEQNTDSDGNAKFTVAEFGNFTVNISMQNYETRSETIAVAGGDPTVSEFVLKPKEQTDSTPKESNDTIDVIVLFNNPADPTSKPAPLPGAFVRASAERAGPGVTTDANGHATLAGSFEVSQSVTVTANGFISKTRSVGLNKLFRYSSGQGSTTFTLDPDLTENSPLDLIIHVRGVDGKSVPNATVDFFTSASRAAGVPAGTGSTDGNGNCKFNSASDSPDVAVSDLRANLTIDVHRTGYTPVINQLIPTPLLKPSLNSSQYEVLMDRDWSALANEITALEARVGAWNNDRIQSADSKMNAESNTFIEQAKSARLETEQLQQDIQTARDSLLTSMGGNLDVNWTDKWQKEISSSETVANQDAEDLNTLDTDAAAAAAKCSTSTDADSLRASSAKAAQLLLDLGVRNKTAMNARDELVRINGLLHAFKTAVQDKIAKIRDLADTAEQIRSNATGYYARMAQARNSLLRTQMTLVAALATLSVKFDTQTSGIPPDQRSVELEGLSQRIVLMQQTLNTSTDSSYNPPILPKAEQDLPEEISDAVGVINDIKIAVEARVDTDTASDVDTMGDTVDGINTTLVLAVGLAADVKRLADECAKSTGASSASAPKADPLPDDPPPAGTATNNSSANSSSTNPPIVAKADPLPEDIPTKGAVANNSSPNSSSSNPPSKPKVDAVPEDNNPPKSDPSLGVLLGGTVGTVTPPTVDAIPEDNPRSSSNSPSNNPPPPSSSSTSKDPNQPSGWEKAGTIIGAVLNGLNNGVNNGGNNGANNGGNRPPSGGGSNRNGGNRNPPPQGGSTPAPAAPMIDLSGNWEVANIAPSDAPCKVWVRMSIKSDGDGSWSGPETVGNNCPQDDAAGKMIAMMFQGLQGTVTVVSTYPGKLRWTLKTLQGQNNTAAGSYDKTEIDLTVNGQTVKFMKK
jgi:hypothetical protein